MLTYFKNIRKKLLSENRFKKYLVYALGEIILVMLGILLAFQVNQWNEKDKNKILEHDLLEELEKSLQSDLYEMKGNINRQKEILTSQNIIIKWLENNEAYSDSLSIHISNSYSYTYFPASLGPYETLKQLGMRKITNDSLRNQISKLYEITYVYYESYSDMYKTNFLKASEIPAVHLSELTWAGVIKVNNVKKLKDDKKHLFVLKTLRNLGEILCYSRMNHIKSEIELTLKMLHKELSNN